MASRPHSVQDDLVIVRRALQASNYRTGTGRDHEWLVALEALQRIEEQFDALCRHAEAVRDSWLIIDADDAHLMHSCAELDAFLTGSNPASSRHPRVVVDFDNGQVMSPEEAPPFESEHVPSPASEPERSPFPRPKMSEIGGGEYPASEPDYDERMSELDVAGAEAGWSGAPNQDTEPK